MKINIVRRAVLPSNLTVVWYIYMCLRLSGAVLVTSEPSEFHWELVLVFVRLRFPSTLMYMMGMGLYICERPLNLYNARCLCTDDKLLRIICGFMRSYMYPTSLERNIPNWVWDQTKVLP